MSGVPSAGWREVYESCHVDVPMTSHGEPPVGARPQSGTNTKKTMSELDESERELHHHAKREIGFVVRDLQVAQESGDLDQMYATVEEALIELTDLESELQEMMA
jgi:hypothetical protein